MPSENTTRNPTADEITGSIAVPPHGYVQPEPTLATKENLLRLFLWAIPIVFTAGALFVSVQTMTKRQDEQERAIQSEKDRGARLEADMRVMQGTVQAIQLQQDRVAGKVESIDEKLNEQRSTLSAIGERLGARIIPSSAGRMSEPNFQ